MAVRITIACPAAHRADAIGLGACLGLSLADAQTYGEPTWRDAGGNLYACASLDVREEWLAAAQAPLVRPAWDVAAEIDMAAAARAQAAVRLWAGDGAPPLASAGVLTVIAGMAGVDAVRVLGLTPVEQ